MHRALLFVFLFLCSIIGQSIQHNVIKTYYISYITEIDANDPTLTGVNETTMEQLLNTDDSPFVPVTLPFPIILFNEYYQRLYVNANGAAHISMAQPCPLNDFAEVGVCTFNNSYYGVVAGFLADLEISVGCPGADISHFQSEEDSFTLAFRRLCYFGSLISNSFRITFFADNHIEIAYDHISRTGSLPTPNYWISGLRLPRQDNTTYNPSTDLTVWNIHAPGIYPLPSQVIDGNKFIICPLSTLWCLKNSTILFHEMERTALLLTTSEISCRSLLNITYGFSLENDPTTVTSSTLLNCNFSTTEAKMKCDVIALRNYLLSLELNWESIPVFLWPAWIQKGSTRGNEYQIIDIPPLQLTVENRSTLLPSTFKSSCSVNEFYQSCASHNCSLCEQDFSCLDNECYKEADFTTIYSDLSCNDICLEPNNSWSLLASNVTDPLGKCCAPDWLDCAGVCFGNNTIALDIYGNIYCCPDSLVVDCNGICGGQAVIDICGVCGGGDFIGYSCFNASLVFLSSPDANTIALYPKFNFSNADFNVTDYFEVVNLSNENINATAWVDSNLNITSDPIISFHNHTLYNNNFYIPSNSSLQIIFNISMNNFYNSPASTYALKQIVVEYNRIGFPLAIYTLSIPVYPQFVNCGYHIHNNAMNTCMRFPGCMYCMNFPHIKVLKPNGRSIIYYEETTNTFTEEKHQGDDDGLEQATNHHHHRARQLFSNLIPNPYKVKNRNILSGHCIDGYYQQDCDTYNEQNKLQIYGSDDGRRRTSLMSFITWIGLTSIVFGILSSH